MTSMYDQVLADEADLANTLQDSRGIVSGICCALRDGESGLARAMAEGLLERITKKLDEHGYLSGGGNER